MTTPPKVSEAEWEVMRLLWKRQPQSAAELVEQIRTRRDWNARTIKTLISRLVRKGAARYEVDGTRYLYSPAVARDTCVRAASESFLHRVFDGSTSPLLAHLVEEGHVTEGDLEELRRLLDARQEDER